VEEAQAAGVDLIVLKSPRSAVLLALCLCVSCAGLPPVPSKGGPQWLRLETDHFVLYSDQTQTASLRTIQEFERVLDAYLRLGWVTTGTLPLKLNVVVFDDNEDFNEFASDEVGGYHIPEALFEPFVVMPRAERSDDWTTLKHELTHYIAYQAIPKQPKWFAEGIASYFETARFDAGGEFVVGAAPRNHYAVLKWYGRIPTGQLMSAQPPSPLSPRTYASSWLLVHYLMSEHGEAFARLQESLARGTAPDTAWQEAFPDLPVSNLDSVLERYLQRGAYAAYSRKVPPVSVTPRVRSLSDADVYALRAKLYLTCPGGSCRAQARERARQNAALALQSDPNQLDAAVLQLERYKGQKGIERARILARAHPDAWLAWLALGVAELGAKGPFGHCDADVSPRLTTLAPRQPYALMISAMCDAAAGNRDQALAASARGLSIQPGNAALLLLRSAVLLALRECDDLQKLMPRLRGIVHGQLASSAIDRIERCEDPRGSSAAQ
jgi:hypothetical protein